MSEYENICRWLREQVAESQRKAENAQKELDTKRAALEAMERAASLNPAPAAALAAAPAIAPAAAPAVAFAAPIHAADTTRRIAAEEALTRAVLGDIEQYLLDSARSPNGTVRIGRRPYRAVDCGAAYGGDSNLCLYMSLSMGDGAAALALKREIAPLADEASRRLGVATRFAALAAAADLEVVHAYVRARKTPVCVFNVVADVAQSYRTADCVNDCVYLLLVPGHFQRLLPC